VTFFRLKPGHLLQPGRALCGRIRLAQIGISAGVLEEINPPGALNAPALLRHLLPAPGAQSHKYTRGHVQVLGGPAGRSGAARLAARGGLRAGAGLVSVLAPPPAMAENAARLDAIMLEACEGPQALSALLADQRRNAVVAGPGAGVGASTRAMVETILAAPPATMSVLDADALTSFEGAAGALAAAIKRRSGAVVLTPHEGEFARLFGDLQQESESNPQLVESNPQAAGKLERARAAARFSGAIIVLKGADTVIAAPDGRYAINANAPPWLATAGSGDVLAGMIAGLAAQAMSGFEAACAAVWMHGQAAQLHGPGLIAEDIPECLPQIWRRLPA